jgi:hypothetical protein
LGGSAAKAREYSGECAGCYAKWGHVAGEDGGRILVGVESCEMLHDVGCNVGEAEGLQAACSTVDVARLQVGVHAGHRGSLRGLHWATAVVAFSVGA